MAIDGLPKIIARAFYSVSGGRDYVLTDWKDAPVTGPGLNREPHCAIFRACYLEIRIRANERAGRKHHQTATELSHQPFYGED